LAHLLIKTFFRQVEIEHADRLDTGRPTVLVADHRNALVDGLLLLATLHRYPRLIGKSTLFRNPLLWPFLHLAGVVPVHRPQDGASHHDNTAAFAASSQVLTDGGLLAVFPEGISHDEGDLQPLRTGAARIALAAARDGVPDVDTVAVALVYDDKQRFRSRALVRVGVPQPVDRWLDPDPALHLAPGPAHPDDRRAVRALTDDLADRIRQAGPQLARWQDAEELVAIADIAARPAAVLPAEAALADRQHVLDALAAADASAHHCAALESLRFAYRQYRRDLDLCGLADDQVAASYRSGTLRSQYLVALAKVVTAAPVAAAGAAIHLVPYQLVKVAASVPANRSVAATVKLVGSFFCYLATYTALGILVGRARPAATWPCGWPNGSTGWAGPTRGSGWPVTRAPSWPRSWTTGRLWSRRSGPWSIPSPLLDPVLSAVLDCTRDACHHGLHHEPGDHHGPPPYLTANAPSRSPATS
jgi:1-acyl-sn-glycerol-3-phosphate acyltransferase